MIIGIVDIAVVVAATACAGAVYKHGSLLAAVASAKKEAALIEAEAVKVEGEVKTALTAIAARLKAL